MLAGNSEVSSNSFLFRFGLALHATFGFLYTFFYFFVALFRLHTNLIALNRQQGGDNLEWLVNNSR